MPGHIWKTKTKDHVLQTQWRYGITWYKEAQANTTSEQSNKNNIYDVGWRPTHGENGGVGNSKKKKKKKKKFLLYFASFWFEKIFKKCKKKKKYEKMHFTIRWLFAPKQTG